MIIGLATKTGSGAQLTGPKEKAATATATAPSEASSGPKQTQDEVTLSASPGLRMEQKISQMRTKIEAQEEFLSQYEYVPNQVLVRLKNEVSNLESFAADYGTTVLHHFDLTGLKASKASSEHLMLLDLKNNLSVAEAMTLMSDDPRVSVVESNDIVHSSETTRQSPVEPNDLEDSLWGLHNHGQDGGISGVDIGVKNAWGTTVGSRTGPIVAVVDTGVDYTHQDLKDNIFSNTNEIPNDGIDNDGNGVIDDTGGYNAGDDNTDPKDDNGHGTHVAGTIGAVGNNGKGVVGVNQQARILPVRFLDAEGAGTTDAAIRALVYASRTGARVVNNSWGGDKYNQLVMDVMADSDALFVCAAGNEAYDNDLKAVYPANYDLDNVISVTAHDRSDEFPRFANRGEKTVDLAAPGVDITSTLPKNKYGLLSGTSMATPHVSGAATLIATARPEVTNEELRFLLMNNLEQLPEKYGSRIISGGRLNVGNALERDTVAPGVVKEAKVDQVTSEKISLSWLATGDDGDEGAATAYEVRYTHGHFKSDDSSEGVPFSQGKRLEVGKPKQANQKETVDFIIPPSGKERHFALGVVAIDNVLNKGDLTTLDVAVPAAKVALEDTADTQETAFVPSEHWTKVEVEGRGQVFTESPEGDYPADRDAVLTSKKFSLEGYKNPQIHFDCKVDVEKKHDKFVVEIEKYGWFGRRSWAEVARFDGFEDWKNHKIDISDYTGRDDMRIRFRLESDRDRNRDGVYLDNIVIAERDT